jgi:hypothetical protein
MNRKNVIVVSALCTVLLGSLALVATYPRVKKIEKRGPAPESVAAILPGDMSAATAAIDQTFNNWRDFDRPDRIGIYQNKFPKDSPWSHFFLFHQSDARNRLFPSDEEILLNRGADSFVQQYVRIPRQLRTNDVYLYEPTGDYYWESEYFYKGRPANFRCSFLIHLEPAGESRTKVEIFEYQPTLWAGEYLGLSAHAVLPTRLHDIRPAEPTTGDRQALLTIIQSSARSQNPDRAP